MAGFAAARLVGKESKTRRIVLDALSMVALASLSALVLDGVALVVAWGLQAAALAEAAGRTKDRVATIGSLGFLSLALGHVLVLEAPPQALAYGAHHLSAAAIGLGVVAATAFQLLGAGAVSEERERATLAGLAAAALVYLCSVAIVTPFQAGPDAPATGLALGVHQQGQVLLSVFWAACGFAALWLGLRRDRRPLRLAGFALLALAVAKVFLFDLTALASIYRVLSLVALGLLLLTAGFVYQRLRAATRVSVPRS